MSDILKVGGIVIVFVAIHLSLTTRTFCLSSFILFTIPSNPLSVYLSCRFSVILSFSFSEFLSFYLFAFLSFGLSFFPSFCLSVFLSFLLSVLEHKRSASMLHVGVGWMVLMGWDGIDYYRS